MFRTFILLIFLFLAATFLVAGQNAKIKKRTEITYRYWNASLSIDTMVREYALDGNEINSSVVQTSTERYETLDSNEHVIHRKEFWTDSTVRDIFQYNYKDSILIFGIKNSDTTMRAVKRMRGKRVLEETYDWNTNCQKFIYDKQNIFRTKTTEIQGFSEHCLGGDTTKYSYNKIAKTKKEYKYNSAAKEWYRKRKLKFNSLGKVKKSVDRFYNEYWKKYFATRTKYQYNDNGKISYEETVDRYSRTIEKKVFYQYEYY